MSVVELPNQTEVGNTFISNYPPYSQWSLDATAEFAAALEQRPSAGTLGIYVHLPFCAQRCAYCYFRVHVKPASAEIDRYLAMLLREGALYAQTPALRERRLTCVYIGGGTPTHLTEAQLERLINGLQEVFCWDAVEEFTVECNPDSLTDGKLELLRDAGVTRLSIGFQTLNDQALRRSGRTRSGRQSLRAFHAARDAGFQQINIDLLAGLPGETDETWHETIEQVLALAPDCVTVYQMELTYNSTFYAALRKGVPLHFPDWPAKRSFVEQAFDRLEDAGYRVISSYMALAEKARWRLVYTEETLWKGGALLGLGESAFGHLQGMHYQNIDQFAPYVESVEAGKLPLRRALRPTSEERMRREVILLLRLGTLELDYFRRKYHVDLLQRFGPLFEEMAAEGIAVVEPQRIVLTRRGLLMAEWLMPLFYLPEHRGIRYT